MFRSVLLVLLMLFPLQLASAGDTDLESGLIDALRRTPGTDMRTPNSGKAIQDYIRAGALNKKPNGRADYTDYWILKRPEKFMGHDLIVIEEEYMAKYVGCCVSDGAGINVRVIGSTSKLEQFAQMNACTFTADVKLQAELSDHGIKATIPSGRYASLSCRERDARSQDDANKNLPKTRDGRRDK